MYKRCFTQFLDPMATNCCLRYSGHHYVIADNIRA